MVERSLFREWPKYAAAVASDLAAPLLRLWADGRAIGPATPPGEWRRVVMLGSTHIGDVMYRTPSLAYLKRALPHCEVSYVTSPLTAALVETNPAVDVVLPIAETGPAWRRDMTRVLRSYRFDAAICTDNISYHRDLLLVARSGIPARIGFAHKGFSALVTDAVPAPTRLPAPAYTRALIAHVCRLDPTWDLTPVLATTPEDEQRADTVWRDLGLGAAPVTIACAMTLRQVMTATWPPRSFIAALSDVARDIDLEVVLCGSTADGPLLRDAARRAPFPCRVAAGTLTLRALGALFRRCRLLLAMDSGPRHIANAVGTPVVFVRSLRVSRIEAGVYCANETDVAPDEEWLGLQAQRAALDRLDPRAVATVIRQRLSDARQPYDSSADGGTARPGSNRRSPVP